MAEKVVVRGIKTLSFYAVELNNKLRAGDGIRTRENCLEGSYVTNYITPAYCKQCTPAASIVHIGLQRAGREARTLDICVTKAALYQLSYPGKLRTCT